MSSFQPQTRSMWGASTPLTSLEARETAMPTYILREPGADGGPDEEFRAPDDQAAIERARDATEGAEFQILKEGRLLFRSLPIVCDSLKPS